MFPLVSIITPSYNHVIYLDEYFHGLLSQSYRHIELIIIDDASTDGSWSKICRYEDRLRNAFPRVLLRRHEKNIGLIRTLNEARGLITGDYVSILETDDYYKPDKLAENVEFLTSHPHVGCVHSDVDFLYEDQVQYSHWASLGREIPQGNLYERLLFDNIILTCTFCCRSDLFLQYADFERYARRGYLTADYPLFLDLARHTQFGYIDKSLAVYRVVENSISHPDDPKKQFLWKKAYYQTKLDYIKMYGASDEVVERAEKQHYRNYYWYGYENYCWDEFELGYNWLKRRYKKDYDSFPYRLRELGMKNKTLWKIIRWIDRLEVSSYIR